MLAISDTQRGFDLVIVSLVSAHTCEPSAYTRNKSLPEFSSWLDKGNSVVAERPAGELPGGVNLLQAFILKAQLVERAMPVLVAPGDNDELPIW